MLTMFWSIWFPACSRLIMSPVALTGTENDRLTELLEAEKTREPTLMILLVRPNSGLFEPLWPTVMLARTKGMQCRLPFSAWLIESMTLVAIALLSLNGDLTVSIYRLGPSPLELLSAIVGRLAVLIPSRVTLALWLDLIMAVMSL